MPSFPQLKPEAQGLERTGFNAQTYHNDLKVSDTPVLKILVHTIVTTIKTGTFTGTGFCDCGLTFWVHTYPNQESFERFQHMFDKFTGQSA